MPCACTCTLATPAAFHGFREVVATLCEHGVDLDKPRSDDGSTPLIIAGHQGFQGVAQLLAACGANLAATDAEGSTAHTYAAAQGHDAIAQWLDVVAHWTPFQIAIGCRLHAVATRLLKMGVANVERTPPSVLRAIASTVQPWPQAPAVCPATMALVRNATTPYSPATHWLYHPGVHEAVCTVLLVSERLFQRRNSQQRHPGQHVDAALATKGQGVPLTPPSLASSPVTMLPELPPEMWLFMLRFISSSFWAAPRPAPPRIRLPAQQRPVATARAQHPGANPRALPSLYAGPNATSTLRF